jgi:hypothetical protein
MSHQESFMTDLTSGRAALSATPGARFRQAL